MTKLLLAALVAGFGCTLASAAGAQSFSAVERGRQVAVAADCTACHTVPGGEPFAGGVSLETPFGTLIGPNITPDQKTGIGAYSREDLARVLREGVAPGDRRLYPAMPYTAYNGMTDEDIAALYAYLRTVKPVENAVEANQLPFPFNVRLVMAGWNLLNYDGPRLFEPDDAQSSEWNRGAYLVNVLGHCGACHTPKTMLGADNSGEALRGAVLQGWFAPDITSDRHVGIGAWTQDDIVTYLKTGVNAHSFASGPMAEAVTNSTSNMSEGDLRAIATYLSTVPGTDSEAPAPLPIGDRSVTAGAEIYVDRCSSCHNGDGSGQTTIFPKLASSAIVNQSDPTTLIRLVLGGSRAAATEMRPTAPAMPAFHWALNDEEVADVLTYIRNSWGNAATKVTPDSVKSLRASFADP